MAARNAAAQDTYAAARAECLALLAELTAKVEGAKPPDEATNWGHAGDMASIAVQLRILLSVGE